MRLAGPHRAGRDGRRWPSCTTSGSITRSPAGAEMVTENVYWEVWRQASLRQAMGALRGLLAADSP